MHEVIQSPTFPVFSIEDIVLNPTEETFAGCVVRRTFFFGTSSSKKQSYYFSW